MFDFGFIGGDYTDFKNDFTNYFAASFGLSDFFNH
jgi:hypothetical protein